MNTFTATPDDISHEWHVVDADGVPLGRLASVVAQLIRGKHKPTDPLLTWTAAISWSW